MFRRNIYAEDTFRCEDEAKTRLPEHDVLKWYGRRSQGLPFAERGSKGAAPPYHAKLMFLLEELARQERVDSDPRHMGEYITARKKAIDLYLAGKDPDPRAETHNNIFPLSYTIDDEMYGCATCGLDLSPSELATAIPMMADPNATPSGKRLPSPSSTWDSPGPIGYEI